jgi:hypothetical protein
MGENRSAFKVLVGKPKGNRPLGRLRRKWEDNIKLDVKDMELEDVNWTHLAQVMDQWRALVNTAINFRVP